MSTAQDKAERLQQQVNAKLVWGARDGEVLDWLRERHGITDAAANDLLTEGHRIKCASVRSKALLYLILSIPGILLSLAFVVLQGLGRFVIIGYGSVLILLFGFVSLGVFFRSLYRLLTGHTEGSVN